MIPTPTRALLFAQDMHRRLKRRTNVSKIYTRKKRKVLNMKIHQWRIFFSGVIYVSLTVRLLALFSF